MNQIKTKVNELAQIIDNCTNDYGEVIANSVQTMALHQLVNALQSEICEAEKRQKLNATYAKPSAEMVSHPDHYQGASYECIDVMLDVYGKEKTLAFCELNAFKYLWRSDSKGTDIQDKSKAIWYLDKYNELKQEEELKKTSK